MSEKNEQPAAKSGGLLGKLIIAGFMGGVVALECALAYLFMPKPEIVAAMAEASMQKKLPVTLTAEDLSHDHASTGEAMIEVDLGEYRTTVTPRNSSTPLRVDFHLVGIVAEKDESEVSELVAHHQHRFRDVIHTEIRNSSPEDFEDPSLGLIKRRILEKSNNLFGKPILRSAVISDFSYIAQ